MFCSRELEEIGLAKPIAQINYSITRKKGAVRGLHYQNPPHAETKIVYCMRGKVFDVAVDIRPESPTYLRWHAEELSPENRRAFCIPEGFAHGFQTLEEDTELLYLHTEFYSQPSEGALNVADSRLAISWPLAITEISERDRSHAFIGHAKPGMSL